MRYEFIVQKPMGGGSYFEVCRCADARAVAAVVTAMLECGRTPSEEIRIVTVPITDELR